MQCWWYNCCRRNIRSGNRSFTHLIKQKKEGKTCTIFSITIIAFKSISWLTTKLFYIQLLPFLSAKTRTPEFSTYLHTITGKEIKRRSHALIRAHYKRDDGRLHPPWSPVIPLYSIHNSNARIIVTLKPSHKKKHSQTTSDKDDASQ